VSEYLKRNSSQPEEDHNRVELTLPTNTTSSSELGNSLHTCLEIWNGSESTITDIVPDNENKEKIIELLKALASLSELKEYFLALQSAEKQHQVHRELSLMIHQELATLSGVADAVFFRSENEIWIIDWKSSTSFSHLDKPARKEQILQQLKLYASSFKKIYPEAQIKLLAIALVLYPKTSAKILLDCRL
jgi:ATP-dependent exoDNAse (exonuclease V) beta subunit